MIDGDLVYVSHGAKVRALKQGLRYSCCSQEPNLEVSEKSDLA